MIKEAYQVPSLTIEWVEIEYSIAAGSANVTMGTPGNEYSPEVDEWNEGDYRSTDLDI